MNEQVITGPNAGTSALYWLASSEQGCKLLATHFAADDGEHIKKINITAVSVVIDRGPEAGRSVLYGLAKNDDGRRLLHIHQSLRNCIDSKALNTFTDSGKHAGHAIIYELACSEEGHKVLAADNGKLMKCVEKEALNAVMGFGSGVGTSALYWLASMLSGRALLRQYQSVKEKIDNADILAVLENSDDCCENAIKNSSIIHMISHEANTGPSHGNEVPADNPWLYMTSRSSGCEIILRDSQLRQYIDVSLLNMRDEREDYKNQSIAFWLARSQMGRKVLAADDGKLIKSIGEDTPNAVISSGHHAGTSVLYWLGESDDGRRLLSAHQSVRDKINAQGLNSLMSYTDEADTSALYWLTSDELGRELLAADSGKLIGLIEEKALNTVVAFGKEAHTSALYWLAKNADGREFLLVHANLRKIITNRGLNYSKASGDDAGASVLYWLANSVQGCKILADNQDADEVIITAEDRVYNQLSLVSVQTIRSSIATWLKVSLRYQCAYTMRIASMIEMVFAMVCGQAYNRSDIVMSSRKLPVIFSIVIDIFVKWMKQFTIDIQHSQPASHLLQAILEDKHGVDFLVYFDDVVPTALMNDSLAIPMSKLSKSLVNRYCNSDDKMALAQHENATLRQVLACAAQGRVLLSHIASKAPSLKGLGFFRHASQDMPGYQPCV